MRFYLNKNNKIASSIDTNSQLELKKTNNIQSEKQDIIVNKKY